MISSASSALLLKRIGDGSSHHVQAEEPPTSDRKRYIILTTHTVRASGYRTSLSGHSRKALLPSLLGILFCQFRILARILRVVGTDPLTLPLERMLMNTESSID
jgi:hypothetical protein